jgi:hypothetical protein
MRSPLIPQGTSQVRAISTRTECKVNSKGGRGKVFVPWYDRLWYDGWPEESLGAPARLSLKVSFHEFSAPSAGPTTSQGMRTN